MLSKWYWGNLFPCLWHFSCCHIVYHYRWEWYVVRGHIQEPTETFPFRANALRSKLVRCRLLNRLHRGSFVHYLQLWLQPSLRLSGRFSSRRSCFIYYCQCFSLHCGGSCHRPIPGFENPLSLPQIHDETKRGRNRGRLVGLFHNVQFPATYGYARHCVLFVGSTHPRHWEPVHSDCFSRSYLSTFCINQKSTSGYDWLKSSTWSARKITTGPR